MTRLSKQERRRMISPKRPKVSGTKTGPKKDNLKLGYKEKLNAFSGDQIFIAKIKSV